MSRVEFGYIDFVGRHSEEGRLTFFRTSAGRGRAFITVPDKRVQIFQPPSFVRACDQIADVAEISKAFMWNELAMRGVVVGSRTWQVESMSGDVMASGEVLDVFDAPHELVKGLVGVVAALCEPAPADSDGETANGFQPGQEISKGFRVLSLPGF